MSKFLKKIEAKPRPAADVVSNIYYIKYGLFVSLEILIFMLIISCNLRNSKPWKKLMNAIIISVLNYQQKSVRAKSLVMIS